MTSTKDIQPATGSTTAASASVAQSTTMSSRLCEPSSRLDAARALLDSLPAHYKQGHDTMEVEWIDNYNAGGLALPAALPAANLAAAQAQETKSHTSIGHPISAFNSLVPSVDQDEAVEISKLRKDAEADRRNIGKRKRTAGHHATFGNSSVTTTAELNEAYYASIPNRKRPNDDVVDVGNDGEARLDDSDKNSTCFGPAQVPRDKSTNSTANRKDDSLVDSDDEGIGITHWRTNAKAMEDEKS